MDASGSDSDSDIDNQVEDILWTTQLQMCVVAGTHVAEACNHFMKYCLKTPLRDSNLSGPKWIWELWHGHEKRFFQNMRMRKPVLSKLIEALVTIDSLPRHPKRVPLEESLAIFLLIVGQGLTYPVVEERLQRSSETISNHFHMVLNGIAKLGCQLIKPLDDTFSDDPPQLTSNNMAWPYFCGCVGALDGTHIALHIPEGRKVPWMNRKGIASTNVLAVCDFNMCITFAAVGMEGSMHDSRVLNEAMKNRAMNFPRPPPGKFYLGDTGYPLMNGILTPYRKTRYHLPEYRSNRVIRNINEHFNYIHSSLRSVIERSFGVLKKRWRILNTMSMVSLETQIKIIWACIALHNFIRRYDSNDLQLLGDISDDDQDNPSTSTQVNPASQWINVSSEETRQMEHFRNSIRDALPTVNLR